MYKLSTFLSERDQGYSAIPLFGPADSAFEKTAAPSLLPEVLRYIDQLRPRAGSQYVLVNAMGAGEYYGSNINGDHFEEAGLIHTPPGWRGDPAHDKALGKSWTYGYPTFYNAYPYAHHRNKDPGRAYGDVELAVWHEEMKRVELVCRVDHDKCLEFGGVPVWDKLKVGQFPDVSMGSKVCFDLSSITLDKDLYQRALATFDHKKHPYPGIAALEFHKKLKAKDGVGVRGLSITRADYDEWTRNHMNRILPDGRKVFVYNPFPRFFDISFVFIGADRTAKTMVFIVRHGDKRYVPSAEAGEKVAHVSLQPEELLECKEASVQDEVLLRAFGGKLAGLKQSELTKEIPADKAVTLLEETDEDLPGWAMRALEAVPQEKALGTTAGMGIVLKPREFQRITLARLGGSQLLPCACSAPEQEMNGSFGAADFLPALARILQPLLARRSGLGPFIEQRVLFSTSRPEESITSHSPEDLRKIGAAYSKYRNTLMNVAASAQDLLPSAFPAEAEISKLSSAPAGDVFTPLSFGYLRSAFRGHWDAEC